MDRCFPTYAREQARQPRTRGASLRRYLPSRFQMAWVVCWIREYHERCRPESIYVLFYFLPPSFLFIFILSFFRTSLPVEACLVNDLDTRIDHIYYRRLDG